MKKFVSILIALSLAISSLFAFSINAYANSLKTAVQIMLGQSINATVSNVDDNAKNYWFKFDCLSSNYYDLLTSSQALTSADVFLTVYNADKTVINSNINSNTDFNFNTTTYFEAGKTYYYVLESASVSFSNVVSVRNHNHDFSLYNSYPAHYDQYDSAQNYDGYVESICAYCPEYIRTASFPAVSSVKAKTKSFTYNKKKKTTSVKVYDRMGNVVSPSNYTVSYKNNTKPGYATLTVKFKGNYSGTAIIRLTIKPKKEKLSSLKSTRKKKMTVKWKKDKTVTGYQIQYSTSKKYAKKSTKTVTISKKSTTSKTISKLKSKKKYYVRIRAYKKSAGKKIYGAWSKTKTVKVK